MCSDAVAQAQADAGAVELWVAVPAILAAAGWRITYIIFFSFFYSSTSLGYLIMIIFRVQGLNS